jgi:hypothetical protein
MGAEHAFGKQIFHALGNHECQGFTASNCPNATESANIRSYMMNLVPFTKTPNYAVSVMTDRGEAKFLFIAQNAWGPTQKTWLEAELSRPTPYTFVVRHEPTGNTDAPGMAESDAIIAAHPVTLGLYGHTHTYRRIATNAVIVGNGGAPITYGHYGYVYVVQRTDGNVQVEEHRYDDNTVADGWILTPSGERAAQ